MAMRQAGISCALLWILYGKEMMEKNVFVDGLKEGDRFDDLFLIKNVREGETRAGKPYLVLTVMDKSGEVSGPVWDNVAALQKICVAGEVVQLAGTVQSYRDTLQLRIDAINQIPQQEIDLGHFYPAIAEKHRTYGRRTPEPGAECHQSLS